MKHAFEGHFTGGTNGWKKKCLKEICLKIQDGSHFSPQVQFDTPGKDRFLYITAKNIRTNYMDFRKVVYVDKAYHQSIFNRCNPEFGDVLFTKDGINTGDVTLNTLTEPFSLLSSVCLFKTIQNVLSPTFLKYYLQSPVGRKAILGKMTGTAIKRIVLRQIKDATISLPNLIIQNNIINEIETRLSESDYLLQTINEQLKHAESLRQSILQQAFNGEL